MVNQDRLMQLFTHLRTDIASVDSRNNQFLTLIVTATGIILTIGFNQGNPERPWIFLCVYVFLIPAYNILYGNRRHVWRISTYLRVFVEPNLAEVKWETRLDQLRKITKEIKYPKLSSGISFNEYRLVSGLSLIIFLALLVNYILIVPYNKIYLWDYRNIYSLLPVIIGFILFLWFYFKGNKITNDLQRNGLVEQLFYESWLRIKTQEESDNKEDTSKN